MTKKIYIAFFSLCLAAAGGCSGYLDMVPEKDIQTIESIFEIESSAMTFYNGCYYCLQHILQPGSIRRDASVLGGKEFTAGEYCRTVESPGYIENFRIPDGLQNTSQPYDNQWSMFPTTYGGSIYSAVRYCNIFIENIDKVVNMTVSAKEQRKAEIKCMKAFYYFELVKRYGPICLVPSNIDPSVPIEQMQLPRSHIDSCFNEIVRLFDESIPHLLPLSSQSVDMRAHFSKETAAAYKAKVLVFAASPLYNGNDWFAGFKNRDGENLFSPDPDIKKWQRAAEATEEAVRLCETAGLKLVENSVMLPTQKRRTIRDIQNSVLCINYENPEAIMLYYDYGSDNPSRLMVRFTGQDSYAPSGTGAGANSRGYIGTNIRMAELFYTDNGVPIEFDRTWSYIDRYKMGKEASDEYIGVLTMDRELVNLHLRREPRFYANIATDGTIWEFGPSDKDSYNRELKVYQGETNGIETAMINPSQPQNIGGYWVKKKINPEDTPTTGSLWPQVFMRMADLYLLHAEAWNEAEGPSEKVYDAIDKVRMRAGINKIRDAWENYTSMPGKVLQKEGLREEIRRERMIELAFEGQHCWDLRRWKTAHLVWAPVHYGWNVTARNAQGFYNNSTGPIAVWQERQFMAPRDYFWPIKAEEVMISNIVQNPVW